MATVLTHQPNGGLAADGTNQPVQFTEQLPAGQAKQWYQFTTVATASRAIRSA